MHNLKVRKNFISLSHSQVRLSFQPPTQGHNTLLVANGDILAEVLHLILTVQRSVVTTHPLDVVHTIYLLVLRVRAIVTRSDW